MNKSFRIIVWLFIATPVIYLAVAWNKLPERLALHFNLQGEPDRYGGKIELLFVTLLLVILASLIHLFLPLSYKIDPRKTAAGNKLRLQQIALAIAILISFVACLAIHTALTGNIRFDLRLIFGSIGLSWCIIGNYMYALKPNYFAGFRTRWALNDDENWKRTNLLAGKLWFTGGLMIAIACLLAPRNTTIIIFISISLIITLTPAIYSYQLYRRHLPGKN